MFPDISLSLSLTCHFDHASKHYSFVSCIISNDTNKMRTALFARRVIQQDAALSIRNAVLSKYKPADVIFETSQCI